MSEHVDSLRKEIGIQCLFCGNWELPPNRKIDNWTCNYCHAGFLSIAMITNLVPREFVTEIKAKSSTTGEARPCAMCKKNMRQVKIWKDDLDVDLEYCAPCSLCWFEGGSIVKFLRLGGIRPNEGGVWEELTPKHEPRVKLGEKRPPEVKVLYYRPTATIFLFGVIMLAGILASQLSSVNLNWGFAKEAPFRQGGLTLLTNLFLSNRLDFLTPLLFLGCGVFYERRLGSQKLLTLFALSGIFGRLGYTLISPEAPLLQTGPLYPAVAVGAYTLANFPFAEYLYADPNRESVNTKLMMVVMGTMVGLLLIYGIDILNDQLHSALNGRGLKTTSLTSLIPLPGPEWIGYFIAGSLGLISSREVSNVVSEKTERTRVG